MTALSWLKPIDCPLLQPDSAGAEETALRMVQRLLEMSLTTQGVEQTAAILLEEINAVLRADSATIVNAGTPWQVERYHARPGSRFSADVLPHALLGEVLDREAGACQDPGDDGQPACLFAYQTGNRVLLVRRARESFDENELAYGVAAAHYLGTALQRAEAWDQQVQSQERLETLVAIGNQLVEQRETVPLLEHIAEQAARLLRCERSSIFLWDKSRNELVGRPALGLPNGELRIPDDRGIVGQVVKTGQIKHVDDVRNEPLWNPEIDSASGFQTRNLLCVPLRDTDGQRLGALEVMNKNAPYSAEDIETLEALGKQTVGALLNVQEHEALVRSKSELDEQARQGALIVGEASAIEALRSTLDRVAPSDLPVLILGESGTGKDVVARAIHYRSRRYNQPFIPVNCAAIAETLLESELFGHEKGSFTGAEDMRKGKFEAASGGTLFLDEIGDLSAGGQAKLLRVLEEQVVYRVGGTQAIPVNTRIIAATNRNLAESVQSGKFRQDLYYRLTVVTMDLPALRDRREDILVLADHFLKQFCREARRKTLKLSAEARKRLSQHNWPGNVRELRNLLERLAYLCPNNKVEANDLAFILQPQANDFSAYLELGLTDATKAFQRDHIEQAIRRSRGNVSEAAKLLGLHRPNLYRKMKLLKMEELVE